MVKFKIKHNLRECVGCGVCVELCSNWVKDGYKVKPVETELDELGCNGKAAEDCPTGAIKITKLE